MKSLIEDTVSPEELALQMALVPISDQLACVRREIALRRNVYPRQIANSKMKAADAEREIKAMEAVLATLQDVFMYQSLVKSLSLPPAEVARMFERLAGQAST